MTEKERAWKMGEASERMILDRFLYAVVTLVCNVFITVILNTHTITRGWGGKQKKKQMLFGKQIMKWVCEMWSVGHWRLGCRMVCVGGRGCGGWYGWVWWWVCMDVSG